MIAGTNSGCGKTTVTLGILHLLVKKGLKSASFKVGPDYIDPGHHKAFTGKPGSNIDSWLMSKETINFLVAKSLKQADIGVIEGVMGLYDGISGEDYPEGSSAHIAEMLEIPTVLVINAKGMAQSIVALINGFTEHGKNIRFLGVILNFIGSSHHYEILKQLIEARCNLPCFGFIKKLGCVLPERHLGLIPFQELNHSDFNFDEITENLNIDFLLKELDKNSINLNTPLKREKKKQFHNIAIAVARDEAFSFYYEDNLDVLKECGIQIKFFSPIRDKTLPENINGMYFGGGFPEIFAKHLSANKAIMDNIMNEFVADIPIYAECGGLMYLFGTLIDHNDNRYDMAGLIKGTIKMEKKRQGLGYYIASLADSEVPLLRGHQFHYSRVIAMEDPDVLPLYKIKKPAEKSWKNEGFRKKNLMASYLHLHFRDQQQFVAYLLSKCSVIN